LKNFTQTLVGGAELKKFFTGLFHLCRDMKALLGVSGTHNNDPMCYVDQAKVRVNNASAHRLALYFFYVKCEDNDERIDSEFVAVSLPAGMKGSSTELDSDISTKAPSVSVAPKAAAAKSSQLEASERAFSTIAATMAAKEKREAASAKRREALEQTATYPKLLEKGNFSPETTKWIQDKALANAMYGERPQKRSRQACGWICRVDIV
jgi:hypothetical protein